jgi:hypothetical protein
MVISQAKAASANNTNSSSNNSNTNSSSNNSNTNSSSNNSNTNDDDNNLAAVSSSYSNHSIEILSMFEDK